MKAIERAISIVGSATRLAKILGVSTQAVCFWRNGARGIPAERCPSIERATQGAVRCEDLRPDVDWGYLRQPVALPVAKKESQHA
ncbi:helix-turn-helix domain-containing protein [Castellaniella sp.]|uniref:helix-turn-helix domain-containing protein n=1 Tax=Castellaniella sp. TaxID=1955812 RepID=UPI003A93D1CD